MDAIRALDFGTFYFLQHQANELPFLRSMMLAGDSLGGIAVFLLMGLASGALLWRQGRRRALVFSVAGLALGVVVAEAMRRAVGRLSPQEMPWSFPARSVLLFTLACVVLAQALEETWPGRKQRFAIYVLLGLMTIWVMASQLVLGQHFLTDVLAGAAGGLGLGLLARRLGALEPAASATR